MTLEIGAPAPDFTLPTDDGGTVTLGALRGRKVIVYFYPKDDTPGCTKEACTFRDLRPDFSKSGAEIIGISKDDAASHAKFRSKHELPFILASDADGKVIESYGSWVEKLNYGKAYMGIDRSTFLIDKNGILRGIWRKVRVDGHVEKVLEAAKAL